jgi:hypothetical protein
VDKVGVQLDIVRNCIKLRFSNLTLESLNNLQQSLESGRLQAELNEICKPVLNDLEQNTILLQLTHKSSIELDKS